MKKAYIFDLDGTLLDTINDITFAINLSLKECGYTYSFSKSEVQTFVGNGSEVFVKKALKDKGNDEEAFLQLKNAYLPNYYKYQNVHTCPFPNIKETLIELKRKGALLFVCTNKPDNIAKPLIEAHFPGIFNEVHGHILGSPAKPDPRIVNELLSKYSLIPSDCLFVGDSITDYETAKNASMPCLIFTFGYGYYDEDWMKEVDYKTNNPKELLFIE